jgi:DNA polymerase III epsilon subunit-like protein
MANPTSLSSPFDEVKQCLAKWTDLRVLRHCLGIDAITTESSQNVELARCRTIANQILQHTIVVCIDTEHWTLNSDEMIEIGLVVLKTQDVVPIARAKDFGDHGFNLMEQAKYHFFRLREKAHLYTVNERSRGP